MSTAQGVVGDRYKLHRLIGRGGMADVYLAEDSVLGREVAVKRMRAVSDDGAHQERFHLEARTLAGLSHPGLVTVLDAGFHQDHSFLVMDLVPGANLASRLPGPRSPAVVAELGSQVADALAYVHAAGIVHRDVKPANILLGEDGRARLVDFGIARLLEQGASHTADGLLIGSAAYLAPEQVREQRVTTASDVYALGLVLLELACGERIYTGTPIEAALARLESPPPIPPWLSEDLRNVLTSMTQMKPEARIDPARASLELSAVRQQEMCVDDPNDAMTTLREQHLAEAV